jgi:hypothetical protein
MKAPRACLPDLAGTLLENVRRAILSKLDAGPIQPEPAFSEVLPPKLGAAHCTAPLAIAREADITAFAKSWPQHHPAIIAASGLPSHAAPALVFCALQNFLCVFLERMAMNIEHDWNPL